MKLDSVTTRLWELPDEAARRATLSEALAALDAEQQMALAKMLKGQADAFLRADIQLSLIHI